MIPARADFARVRAERIVGCVLDLASSRRPRSAAFTDASLGNALDMAGSMTTMFDSASMRRAYFPRTTGPKLLRVYSARENPARLGGLSSALQMLTDMLSFSP